MTQQDHRHHLEIESAINDAIRAGNTCRKLTYDATGELGGRHLTRAELDMLEFSTDVLTEKLAALARAFYGDKEHVAGLAAIAL